MNALCLHSNGCRSSFEYNFLDLIYFFQSVNSEENLQITVNNFSSILILQGKTILCLNIRCTFFKFKYTACWLSLHEQLFFNSSALQKWNQLNWYCLTNYLKYFWRAEQALRGAVIQGCNEQLLSLSTNLLTIFLTNHLVLHLRTCYHQMFAVFSQTKTAHLLLR